MTGRLLILAGDGIGPEVIGQARRVLDWLVEHAGLKVEVVEGLYGLEAYGRHGTLMTEATLQDALAANAVLFGATGGPGYDDIPRGVRQQSSLLRLRREMGVYVNLRPVVSYAALSEVVPLKARLVDGVDVMVVRELNGGLYFGEPRGINGQGASAVGTNTLVYNVPEIERVARAAFDLARQREGRLCSVDKSNVLETSALWRQVVSDLGAAAYPDVELSHILVDNCALQLVRDPRQFDVLLADNMFGDILSDIGGAISGSLGMMPSASLNGPAETAHRALYEPVHGSAPDIAGQGVSNPIGAILSLALALRYSLGAPGLAARVEQAVDDALATGARTADIASYGATDVLPTAAMGDAILAALARH